MTAAHCRIGRIRDKRTRETFRMLSAVIDGVRVNCLMRTGSVDFRYGTPVFRNEFGERILG